MRLEIPENLACYLFYQGKLSVTALDYFASKGYRISNVRSSSRITTNFMGESKYHHYGYSIEFLDDVDAIEFKLAHL